MRRFFLYVSIIVVVVAGALFALTFVDINKYRPEMEEAVEGLTGRSLQLRGPLRIGFSLTPTVVVEGVRFGNAKWGSEEDMFTADRVAVKLSLLSLLAGNIDIQRLDIRGARLVLETDPQGAENWDILPTGEEGSTEEGEDFSLDDLPHVVVEDLRLVYRSGRRAQETVVFLERADIEPRRGGFGVGVRGEINGREISVSGFLEGEAEAFSINGLKISYEDLSLSGKLTGRRPSARQPLEIDGELVVETVSLDAFVAEGAETDTPVAGTLFSDAPLPFELLDLVNGQIDVSVEHLAFHALDLSDVHISIALKDGTLQVPIFANYEGTRFEAGVTAASGTRPRVGMTLNAPGLDVGRLLEEIEATDLVEAQGHIGVDLVGHGRSVKALMANLDGKIDIVTGRGQIDSDVFELIAEDLLWALIPKGDGADVARLTCFVGELAFSTGVGDVTAFALVTDKIRTWGEGSVDLGSEKIDLTLYPRPNDPGFLSLSTPVRIAGPLAAPSIYPDAGSMLTDVAVAVGAGILTGGVGAILPLISTENFDADSTNACMEVIAANGGGGNDGDGGVLEGAAEGAGDLVRGVGDLLTSPFD